MSLKVGDTIWHFSTNYRTYVKGQSGPVYREHWQPRTIIGETARSWIVSQSKVPKKGPHPGWAFTEQEIDDDCWQHDHRWRIREKIDRCDIHALRKIAELIGYKP